MAIRGKKPQAYNTITKQNEEVIWRATSIDFEDEKSLADKYRELTNTIAELKQENQELKNMLLAPIPIPKQQGVIVYNGKIQAPNWTLDSSRITISGSVNGINAGEYTAYADLQEGFVWEDNTTERKELTWIIHPGYVKAEPYFDDTIIANGQVQSALKYLRNYSDVDFTLSGTLNFKDPGTYEIGIKPNNNVTWFDSTADMRTLKYTVYSYEDFLGSSAETLNGIRIQNLEDELETLKTDTEAFIAQNSEDMTEVRQNIQSNTTEIETHASTLDSHASLISANGTVLSTHSTDIQNNTALLNEITLEYLNSDHILADAISEALYKIKVLQATCLFHDISEEKLASITKDDILQGSTDSTESITNTVDDMLAQILRAVRNRIIEEG